MPGARCGHLGPAGAPASATVTRTAGGSASQRISTVNAPPCPLAVSWIAFLASSTAIVTTSSRAGVSGSSRTSQRRSRASSGARPRKILHCRSGPGGNRAGGMQPRESTVLRRAGGEVMRLLPRVGPFGAGAPAVRGGAGVSATSAERAGGEAGDDAALCEEHQQGDGDGDDDHGRVDEVVEDLELALAERHDGQRRGEVVGGTQE